MVVGYQCPEHGFHRECDVAPSGQRICPTDETDIAVTGITGSYRSAPPGQTQYGGEIKWRVKYGYANDYAYINAFDLEEAFEAALDNRPDGTITEITPNDRDHKAGF